MLYVLVLDTGNSNIFMRHYVDCGKWDNHGCELLYSIKLLNFRDGISESLQSLFIDVGSQAMVILQSFDEDSGGGSIICKSASLSFCFEPYGARDSFSHC